MRQKPYYKCYEQTWTNEHTKKTMSTIKMTKMATKTLIQIHSQTPSIRAVSTTETVIWFAWNMRHMLSLFDTLLFILMNPERIQLQRILRVRVHVLYVLWNIDKCMFVFVPFDHHPNILQSFVLVCARRRLCICASGDAYVCVLQKTRSKSSCTIKANH